jgi:DNA-binding XRE family transcriptional regulator
LAEWAGFARHTVADLEQGRDEPSWPMVIALAGALGVAVTAFLEEARAPPEPRGPGRPPKPAAPAPPPVEDLQRQAQPRPQGEAPKRPRAKPPRRTGRGK